MKAVVVNWSSEQNKSNHEEIIEFATTAGYEILNVVTFKKEKPHPKQFITEKKLVELIEFLKDKSQVKVIINGNLNTNQALVLEERTGRDVIDRGMLILEIFAGKANTVEIRSQIELAQLKYSAPRMVQKLGESVQTERSGFGGTGEQITDVLVSNIQKRISGLERKLKVMKANFEKTGGAQLPKLPIVGFYSAGKTTIFNILTSSERETGEKAFTTMIFKNGRSHVLGYPIDLVDTVGLVELPRNIFNAFELLLTRIFSYSGFILCIDSSLDPAILENQLMHFGKFNSRLNEDSSTELRVIIILTKRDKQTAISRSGFYEIAESQSWLSDYRIIDFSIKDYSRFGNEFQAVFEELFSSTLRSYSLTNSSPSLLSRLHNASRVVKEEWLNNGSLNVEGIGPSFLLDPILGNTK